MDLRTARCLLLVSPSSDPSPTVSPDFVPRTQAVGSLLCPWAVLTLHHSQNKTHKGSPRIAPPPPVQSSGPGSVTPPGLCQPVPPPGAPCPEPEPGGKAHCKRPLFRGPVPPPNPWPRVADGADRIAEKGRFWRTIT